MDRSNRPNGIAALFAGADQIGAATASCGIAFMAKASAPGRTKTRLVPPLTFDEAAALNTVFLQDVADNVLLAAKQAAPSAGIAGYAAFGPTGSEEFFHGILPPPIGLIEAWLPDFGECLFRTIAALFARGHRSAVVLNSDSPTLPTSLLVATAAALARPGDRAVLGPSTDGGYYLLGLKVAHRRLFKDIAWSTERVAEQTMARAREIGLDVLRLPVWYDVDDAESLTRLRTELGESAAARGRPVALRPHSARHTWALLNKAWADRDFDGRGERTRSVAAMHA